MEWIKLKDGIEGDFLFVFITKVFEYGHTPQNNMNFGAFHHDSS